MASVTGADEETVERSPNLSIAILLAPEKGQQVAVNCLRVCSWHSVWEIFIRLENAIL
jgi:hypothetical protein